MTAELFANNFACQLAQGCAAGDTTLVLNATVPAALQAAGQWRATLSDANGTEYIIVPGGQAGPTVTGVTRAAETGTGISGPTSHVAGSWVTHLITAGALFGGTTASVVTASSSPTAGQRAVASGTGVGVLFEPVTEYDARIDFGVMWDGITDDSVNLNSALSTVSAKRGRLLLPSVNPSGAAAPCNITQTLVVPSSYGLHVKGAGREASIIQQATSNIPIMAMGGSGSNPFHSCAFEDFQLTYASAQPATNTSALAMQFDAMMYESRLIGLWFDNCYYGLSVASGISQWWGSWFDDLVFGGGISGGAMDGSLGMTAGIPNNRWGRIFVTAINMNGPIFNLLRGYNWTIDTIEIIQANQGPRLFNLSQQELDIRAIKCEIGTWGAASNGFALLELSGCRIKLGQVRFTSGGTGDQLISNVGAGGKLYLIRNSGQYLGSQPAKTNIDLLETNFVVTTGTVFAFYTGADSAHGYFDVGTVDISGGGVSLFDSVSSASGEVIVVRDYVNGHLSQDQGDANYVVTLGSFNVVAFNTAFTAQRTITLPNVPQNIPNGTYYEFVFGAGTLTNFGALIQCNSATLYTQAATASKVVIRVMYRRSTVNVQSGWVCTKYETGLPF